MSTVTNSNLLLWKINAKQWKKAAMPFEKRQNNLNKRKNWGIFFIVFY